MEEEGLPSCPEERRRRDQLGKERRRRKKEQLGLIHKSEAVKEGSLFLSYIRRFYLVFDSY